ncbi:SMI1/KNR4 family protein [Actinomycetaceae bacterium L2_0104]
MSSDDAALPKLDVSLWPAFVDRLVEFSPADCREAVLTLKVESGSFSHWSTYDGEPAPTDFDAPDFFDDAWELVDPLQDALGVHQALVVIRAGAAIQDRYGARGRVDAFVAPAGVELGLASHQVSVIPLVPGALPTPFRYVPPPEAYDRPVSPKADPRLVAERLWQHVPDAVGASEELISATEAKLGVSLPEEVRALYRTVGSGDILIYPPGQGPGEADENDDESAPLFFLDVVALDDEYQRSFVSAENKCLSWQFGAGEVAPADPEGRVAPAGWSPAWFVLGGDWGGSYLVADLAPGPNGYVGQLLWVDRDWNSGAAWVADSLASALREGNPYQPEPERPVGAIVRVWDRDPIAAGELGVRDVSDIPAQAEVVHIHFGGTEAGESSHADQSLAGSVAAAASEGIERLADLPGLRTLMWAPAVLAEHPGYVDTLGALRHLEYLEIPLADWRSLLAAGRVPSSLLAAGVTDSNGLDGIDVVNDLLALYGRQTGELSTTLVP